MKPSIRLFDRMRERFEVFHTDPNLMICKGLKWRLGSACATDVTTFRVIDFMEFG